MPIVLLAASLAVWLCLPLSVNAADWFGPVDETSIPSGASGITVGELNGDEYPDVAIGYTDTVRVYFGDGSGGFDFGVELPSPSAATIVVVGDFNGDGDGDIASTDYQSGPQRIHYGDGQGAFPSVETFESALNGIPLLRAADLDKDGYEDLIIASHPRLQVCWGSESGMVLDPGLLSFSVNGSCNVTAARDIEIAETSDDGRSDVIVLFKDDDATCFEGRVRGIGRFRNLGSRDFGLVEFLIADPYEVTGEFWNAIESGDFDGDGDLDFLVASQYEDGFQSVLKTSPTTWVLGPMSGWGAKNLACADLDGDDVLDAVLAGWVFRGNGDATFDFECGVSSYLYPPICADLDGDGDVDLLGRDYSQPLLSAYPNRLFDPADVPEGADVPSPALVLPSVVRAGDWVSFRNVRNSVEVVDAGGRVAARISVSNGRDAIRWAVPADFPSGRYWIRSGGGKAHGSFVIIR